MNKDITVTTIGNYGKNKDYEEYTTTVKCDDKEFKAYFGGYEGISFEDIMKLLNVVGIEPFVVHKNNN